MIWWCSNSDNSSVYVDVPEASDDDCCSVTIIQYKIPLSSMIEFISLVGGSHKRKLSWKTDEATAGEKETCCDF